VSRDDLRILLRFEFDGFSSHFDEWTQVVAIWEGPDDDDILESFL